MVLNHQRRILQCDVIGPRELFSRALEIEFDTSTSAPTASSPLHPEHSPLHQERGSITRDGVGVDVLGSEPEEP